MNKLEELPLPMGDFILSQTDLPGITTPNGTVYTYADVCVMLGRLKKQQEEAEPMMIFYAVRSADGSVYYRNRGYNSYSGDSRHNTSWVTDLAKAKTYTRPGPAKSIVTFYSKDKKTVEKFGIPVVVELHVKRISDFDEAADKLRKKKQKKANPLKKELKNTNEFFKLNR